MAIKWELSAVTGTYTNKSGEEKRAYVRCGVIMDTKKGGLVAKIEALPVNFDGWIYLNEPKFDEPKQATAQKADADKDIPW